jgi:hypothetical protein
VAFFWIVLVLLLLSRGNGGSATISITPTPKPQTMKPPTVVDTPLANGNLVSSSPLTADQKVIGTIASDIGPVPIVTSSLTQGNLLNIAQVFVSNVSHFVATYRDGSQAEVTATGTVIGPWPPSDHPEESSSLMLS